MPKTIAYLRVSTVEQDTEKNKSDILKFANDHDFGKVNFIEEKISGTKSWKKRKIKAVIESLRNGDRCGETIRMYAGLKHSSCTAFINEQGGSVDELQMMTDHARRDSVLRYAEIKLEAKRRNQNKVIEIRTQQEHKNLKAENE